MNEPRSVHLASTTFGDEEHAIVVFSTGVAIFGIVAGDAVHVMRELSPDEDGSDIAISGDARAWFDRELAAGRAKAKDGAT